jgi:uncharacterized protein with von Willebrand factor type A (vWA) domain
MEAVSIANNNLAKLKELSDKLCKISEAREEENKYKEFFNEIKKIFENQNINTCEQDLKNKFYEDMCSKIKIMIKNFKLK